MSLNRMYPVSSDPAWWWSPLSFLLPLCSLPASVSCRENWFHSLVVHCSHGDKEMNETTFLSIYYVSGGFHPSSYFYPHRHHLLTPWNDFPISHTRKQRYRASQWLLSEHATSKLEHASRTWHWVQAQLYLSLIISVLPQLPGICFGSSTSRWTPRMLNISEKPSQPPNWWSYCGNTDFRHIKSIKREKRRDIFLPSEMSVIHQYPHLFWAKLEEFFLRFPQNDSLTHVFGCFFFNHLIYCSIKW